jgi:PBSX family phage terminase large subunit
MELKSLTNKQRLIAWYNNSERPYLTILEGAVRSGKTFINNLLFTEHLYRYKNSDFIITGNTIGSLMRKVLEPMRDMFKIDTRLNMHGCFTFETNRVHCFGADAANSYQSITGMTACGWYANEVTLQHSNTLQEAFSRCSGPGARVFWDSNPDYPEHPVKVNYIDRTGELDESGRVRIKSWHFELADNTFLPPEYVDNLKYTIPAGMWYDRRVKGLWVAAEGVVYENFNRDIHVFNHAIPDTWQRVRGIDWGFTNPFVCLFGAVDPDGRLWIYDEHYQAGMLIKDHADIIKQKSGSLLVAWTVADHDPQDNAEIARLGIKTRNAQKDVSAGIQKVAARLIVQKDGKPRLLIHEKCSNVIREMQIYRQQVQRDGKPIKEEPLKVDDHSMDALRYIVFELDNKSIPTISVQAFC